MTAPSITITYDINKPVALTDFVASLQSIEDLHSDKELKLYVKEIRKGSYVFELINQAPDFLPTVSVGLPAIIPTLAEYTTNLVNFIKNIRYLVDFFKLGEKEGDRPLPTKQEAIATYNIVAPVTVDKDATLNITNNGEMSVIVNNIESNAIQNNASRYIKSLDERTRNIHKKVSLQWYNISKNEQAGNKSIIADIHKTRAVVTKFGNETIHQEMVKRTPHPFNHLWEVDVHVEWHNKIPKRYTILEIVEDLGSID